MSWTNFWTGLANTPEPTAIAIGAMTICLGLALIALVLALPNRTHQAVQQHHAGADETPSVRNALHGEMMAYTRATVLATSNLNLLTESKGTTHGPSYFGDPVVFRAVAGKIGLLGDVALITAITIFYENLIHVNGEFQRYANSFNPAVFDAEGVSYRLRLMCYNLARALEDFSGRDTLKVPSDLKSTDLYDRNGKSVWTGSPKPATLVELLRVM